jgi:hypothetical protein
VFLLFLPGCYTITIRKISCPVVEIPDLTQTEEHNSGQKLSISNLVSYVGCELISQGFLKNEGYHLDYYSQKYVLLSAFILDDPLEKKNARKLQVVVFYAKKDPNVIFIQFEQESLPRGREFDNMDRHCNKLIEKICDKLKFKETKKTLINKYIIMYKLM